jgi:HNH endonuclease/AP2 domain
MITKEYLQDRFEYRNGNFYRKFDSKSKPKKGDVVGSKNKGGYIETRLFNKQYKLHKLIWLYFYGYLPKYIDHINGVTYDNRIENLREANHSENMMNTKMRITNKTGIKGVNWHKASNKWTVQLMVNQKKKYFGIYDDIELAELVAIEARNKYHGEFARHN